jgi:glucosamine kinase
MGSSEESRIRVVGADGGGTRLRLALADGTGRILARRETGPALMEGSPQGGTEALALLVRSEAAALAGETGGPLPLDALCAGLAGAGRSEEARQLEDRLLDSGIARRVRVVPDAEVALLDAFPAGPGILLAAGTGSIAVARDAAGRIHRAGGWGRLLGDEGSGYALGLEGLRAAIRGQEGRGPSTRLTAALFEAIGVPDPEGALAWVRGASKAEIAALAPKVAALGAAVEAGPDPVARELAERAVRALVAHAEALAVPGPDSGGPDRGPAGPPSPRPRVALAGGLVDPGGPLRRSVAAALDAAGFEVDSGPVDGARGAVRCAVGLARKG